MMQAILMLIYIHISSSRANLGFIVFAQIQIAKKRYLSGSQVPKFAHKFIGKASEVKIFEQL